MSVFSGPILRLLMFKDSSAERAAPWLSVAALSVIFLGIIALTNAFLNSAEKQRLPIISMLFGAFVKLVANYFIIVRVGIIGAPFGTLLCYISASALNIYFVIKNEGELPGIFSVFVKPLLCSVASIGTASALYVSLLNRVSEPIVTVLSIITATVIYGILILKTRTVSEEQILLLPFGDKLIKALKAVKIL